MSPAEEFNTAAPRVAIMVASHDIIIIHRAVGSLWTVRESWRPSRPANSGAFVRLAVIVGKDQAIHRQLQLQCLPAAANVYISYCVKLKPNI
jgi:hypothetical protein